MLAILPLFPLGAQTSGQAALWATQGKDCAAKSGEDAPWANKSYSAECRARFALREFKTLDEKLRYLAPPDYMAPPPAEGVPKPAEAPIRDVAKLLGLPTISGADGPAGLVRGGTATAFPSPIAIAASFDRAAATRYGDLIGQEFRAAGLGVILGPAFDVARSWKAGRMPESFGEDPFLVAEMAASEVKAIQANHVMATMKHFAVYTQEAGRVGDAPAGAHLSGNNMVSEKAMREVYLPPFEAAVTRAGAASVMCSFPRFNGVYACENAHLFDILKREWRFDGYVGPDFPSAQRSISRAIMAGLDAASFSQTPFNAALKDEKPLKQAVLDGEVPEARVDDIILRKMVPMFRLGLYDNPPAKQGEIVSTPERRTASAELLADGTVLLKNEKGILPFGPSVRSIAVIGAQATDKATVVEQGSPYVKPAHLAPALAAIQQRAGSAIKVSFAQGTHGLDPLPAPAPGFFRTPDGQAGFRADYYANSNLDFSAKPIGTATLERPDVAKQPEIAGLPANNQWSVRYSSVLTPKLSGVHKFTIHASGTIRLYVDGKLQDQFDRADFSNAAYANVRLTAGKPADIRIDYAPRAALGQERRPMFGMNMGLTLEFGYAAPDTLIADAVKAARAADVAVVFVADKIGEGMDRHSLALQNDQDALIEAVAKVNPHTIVMLNTGGPVAMPWLSRVAGVMEMWKPGDALGPAAAQLLFGDREPGGRLPVTFPADEGQGPATKSHQFPGTIDPRTGELDTA
jgi:beta-glucosidase